MKVQITRRHRVKVRKRIRSQAAGHKPERKKQKHEKAEAEGDFSGDVCDIFVPAASQTQ